jgi:hypothetical protein
MSYKCGWQHCDKGCINDDDAKVKVGQRWYHAECAKERSLIQDTITKFLEYVDNKADIIMVRRVVNNLVFTYKFSAEFVMFALDYAIQHTEVKLTYPAGMYRVCRSSDVSNAWEQKKNREFMAHINKDQFVAKDVEVTPLVKKQTKTGGFSSILGKRGE